MIDVATLKKTGAGLSERSVPQALEFQARHGPGGRRRAKSARAHDRDHLLAAADWLKRAQDATNDGGFVGRYNLRTGWSSSYPETTGYIIPTLVRLADTLGDDEYLQTRRTRHRVSALGPASQWSISRRRDRREQHESVALQHRADHARPAGVDEAHRRRALPHGAVPRRTLAVRDSGSVGRVAEVFLPGAGNRLQRAPDLLAGRGGRVSRRRADAAGFVEASRVGAASTTMPSVRGSTCAASAPRTTPPIAR